MVLRQAFELLLVVGFLAVLVRTFVLSSYRVTSPAMLPNLYPGDYILALRSSYGVSVPFTAYRIGERHPKRGEVVVIRSPEDETMSMIVRVIGLPGDRIEMKSQVLIVNEQSAEYSLKSSRQAKDGQNVEILQETHATGSHLILVNSSQLQSFGPLVVPPGQIFVLGDYRQKSFDSRHFGAVPLSSLESKALVVWLSLDWSKEESPILRKNRIFRSIE